MDVTFKNVGIHPGFPALLVFLVGLTVAHPQPGHQHRLSSIHLENVEPADTSAGTGTASTVEILRNIQTILSTTSRPVRRKAVKQEEVETMGAANALAYLTDSFGGQLAGQILSVILSSVTGDVRGILGNSLNLFQNDERRDQVQLFLDDLSSNFLKFTGLSLLVTTTKAPLAQPTLYPGAPVLYPGSAGQTQVQGIQPAQAISVSGLGGASAGGAVFPPAASSGTNAAAASYLAAVQQRQKQQQAGTATAAAGSQQQPIIYVLPQLANGGTGATSSGSASSGTKTGTANKGTSTGDDDSEEDRKLWRSDVQDD